MKQTAHYQHWKIDQDQQGIMWVTFDRQDSKVNTLGKAVLEELKNLVENIPPTAKGIVFQSGKSTGFIAGADITEFENITSEKEALDFVARAKTTFNSIEKLPITTVALINGFCLGGGFEFALACDYRIALDDPSVRIGLPEVKLGILPGWGGTVRLPRLIGVLNAMNIILPGSAVDAYKAKKLGMIDDIARTDDLLKRAAVYYINTTPPKHQPSFFQNLLAHNLLRSFVANRLTQSVAKKAPREHYPAPYLVIENWQRDGAQGEEAMEHESKAIAELFFHPSTASLVRAFLLQSRLKEQGKKLLTPIKHVHVIGAGTMGGDIASWCALNGYAVTLQDQTPEKIAPAIKRAYDLYLKKLKQPRVVQAAMDRLMPDTNGYGVKHADVIIEAIFEDLEVKKALYKSLEPNMKSTAILATNTSSLPLEELSVGLKNPERLVGIHFFNPVSLMQLVEVVRGKNTSDDTYNQALGFVTKIKRLPLPVMSSPGFLVNRILMPYLLEAIQLYEEGVAPMAIDKAATDFGMPMGPVELADTVGLEICLSVGEILSHHFSVHIPELLRSRVQEKKLGRKSGQGFYQYRDGKPVKVPLYQNAEIPANLTDRLILPMINESVRCWHEGIVSEEDFIDAGLIYGVGFAPFRGGPMHYIETEGAETIVQRLEDLVKECGERFKPDAGWQKLIKHPTKSASTKQSVKIE
ncbi:MAG: enoyl-CoA hydratase/isomerase family protein [Gammaproteobacteria bacterium]|nr:enoyl-CoA hydratase/isomerase family protein [Gammaproteobacteria bacterium]